METNERKRGVIFKHRDTNRLTVWQTTATGFSRFVSPESILFLFFFPGVSRKFRPTEKLRRPVRVATRILRALHTRHGFDTLRSLHAGWQRARHVSKEEEKNIRRFAWRSFGRFKTAAWISVSNVPLMRNYCSVDHSRWKARIFSTNFRTPGNGRDSSIFSGRAGRPSLSFRHTHARFELRLRHKPYGIKAHLLFYRAVRVLYTNRMSVAMSRRRSEQA